MNLPLGWPENADASGNAFFTDAVAQTNHWQQPEWYTHQGPQNVLTTSPQAQVGTCHGQSQGSLRPPAAPPSQGIHRFVHQGRAYWSGAVELRGTLHSICFFEDDVTWQRFKDLYGRVFWSNRLSGVRFFEEPPCVVHLPQPGQQPVAQLQAQASRHALIDTVAACRGAVASLMGESEIGVDLEGVDVCRLGKVSLIQVSTHSGEVFLFDITALGRAAFDAGGLRELFQSRKVRKVIFDGRADNDALHHHFNSLMENAYDLQILHALKFSSSDDRFVKGFQKCLDASGVLSPADGHQASVLKERGKRCFSPDFGGSYSVWEQRPLRQILIDYAVADVQHLLQMKRQWSNPSHDATVEALTRERIWKAVNSPVAPKGSHMSQRDFPLTGGEMAGQASARRGAVGRHYQAQGEYMGDFSEIYDAGGYVGTATMPSSGDTCTFNESYAGYDYVGGAHSGFRDGLDPGFDYFDSGFSARQCYQPAPPAVAFGACEFW